MTIVKINSEVKVGLDEILQGIGNLETHDLEKFMTQVSNLIAQRKAPNLSKEEAELLLKINKGLSKTDSEKYISLGAKLQAETITTQEQKEYAKLIEKTEVADAKRLEHLVVLAGIRGIGLGELMQQLNLNPPFDA